MSYQDPRLNFTSLALSQMQGLSLNRQNLVSEVLRELVALQDHNANDNPFMQGCSLFAKHSKSLTKWGVKITYGVCQDKIDIVCIEVDPSPIPPSGPQAISIRSFSANDNYEFVRHPIVETHFAFEEFEKIAAWLAPTKRNCGELTHSLAVKNFFAMAISIKLNASSNYAAQTCKEKYAVIERIELQSGGLRRCAFHIFMAPNSIHVADQIKTASALTMSAILGLTMNAYNEGLWKLGAVFDANALHMIDECVRTPVMCANIALMHVSDFESFFVPRKCDAPIILHWARHSIVPLDSDDWCSADLDLRAFPWLGAIVATTGTPPCHLN